MPDKQADLPHKSEQIDPCSNGQACDNWIEQPACLVDGSVQTGLKKALLCALYTVFHVAFRCDLSYKCKAATSLVPQMVSNVLQTNRFSDFWDWA